MVFVLFRAKDSFHVEHCIRVEASFRKALLQMLKHTEVG